MADDNLFVTERHPASGRSAVLEDDGTSAWLYLTEPGTRRPAADAWVYNRVAAPPMEAIRGYRGGPPPASREYASGSALCDDPMAYEWSFIWAPDGEAVALARDGHPVALIVLWQKGGYSRELVKDGPWGHPWSDELFRQTLGTT